MNSFKLESGLTVLLNKIPGQVLSVEFGSKFGSAFEQPKHAGAAHFLEHTLFTGSNKYSRSEISKLVDGIGGDINAFTSKQNTRYFIRGTNKNAKLIFDVLGECIFNSVFPIKEIELERKIILNEIREANDKPSRRVFTEFFKHAFKNTEFESPVAGTAETVNNIERKDLKNYFEKYYSPENLVLSIAGNIEEKEVKELIKEHSKKGIKLLPKKFTKPKIKHSISVVEKDTQQTHMVLGFPTIPAGHKDATIFHLINAVLGVGLSSRIVKEVREKRGLSYAVQSMFEAEQDYGFFGVYAASKPNKAEEVEKLIIEQLIDLQENKINENELNKAKQIVEGNNLLRREKIIEIAEDSLDEVVFGKKSFEEELKELKQITSNQIQEIAQKYLQPEEYTLSLVQPKKK